MAGNNLETLFSMRTETETRQGLNWYSDAREHLRAMAASRGTSLKVAAGVAAALSPRVNWQTNIWNCLAILKGLKVKGLYANVAKAKQIKASGIVLKYLKGEKVVPFFLNLIGNENEVTIDTLIINAYHNSFERNTVRKSERQEIINTFKRIAARHRITPAQAQAITWVIWHRVTKSNFPGYVSFLKIF